MLEAVLRDEPEVPELAEVMEPWWAYLREVAGGLAAGWGVTGERQRIVRAAVGHAVDFHAWRSLDRQGLADAEAVELMSGLVAGVAYTASSSSSSASTSLTGRRHAKFRQT